MDEVAVAAHSSMISKAIKDAYLWLLCLGAFQERRNLHKMSGPPQVWFQHNLVKRAIRANKASWVDLSPVLERFLLESWLVPHSSLWFDALVEEVRALGDSILQ
jgi:hypothetical protein